MVIGILPVIHFPDNFPSLQVEESTYFGDRRRTVLGLIGEASINKSFQEN
jgi:hypothetical protein